MATHLEQHLDLDACPAWLKAATARYKGDDPSLVGWLGRDLKMTEVEECIPAGKRGDVEVADPRGGTTYPWRHVAIIEVDELGAVIAHSW